MTKTDLEEENVELRKDIDTLSAKLSLEPDYEKISVFSIQRLREDSEKLNEANQEIADLKDNILESQKTLLELAKALTSLINQSHPSS